MASVRGGGTDKETVGGGGDSGGGGGSGAGLAELRRVMVGSKEVDDPADLISFPLEAIPRQPRTDGKVNFLGQDNLSLITSRQGWTDKSRS